MKASDPNHRAQPLLRRLAGGLAFAALLATLLAGPGPARAQAPAVPGAAPAQPGAAIAPGAQAAAAPVGPPASGPHLRVNVSLIEQMSFITHPFYQITEDGSYANGRAAVATTFSVGARATDSDANFIARVIHALPPFGVEGVMGTGLFLPRGFGYGFDYSPFSQRDSDATNGQAGVTPIRMDLFMYSGVLRFYIFDPNEPGLNYFVGFGLGFIEGKILAQQTAGAASQIISFSQGDVGSKRVGLENRGDNWGVRYEICVISADHVSLDSNPYLDLQGNGPNATKLDMSGTLVRLSLFFHF